MMIKYRYIQISNDFLVVSYPVWFICYATTMDAAPESIKQINFLSAAFGISYHGSVYMPNEISYQHASAMSIN